jgi:alkylation response protein AidB-like acyl-CoA dehydrogenase
MDDHVTAFSPEATERAAREKARSSAETILTIGAEERDRSATFPADPLRALAAQGWMGMRGNGEAATCSTLATLLAVAEFSSACASTGLLIGLHNLVVLDAIRTYGSDTARCDYLPRLARGEMLGAPAFPDPQPTRHPVAPAAHAVRSGDGFVLRGAKSFVPGAVGAGLFLVYAFLDQVAPLARPEPITRPEPPGRPDPPARPESFEPPHRDRVLLLVPRDTDGVSVDPPDPLVGVRACGAATVRFNECMIPASHQVAASSAARKIAREFLAAAEMVVSAQAIGIGEAAFGKAARRALESESNGNLTASREAVQFKIADMRVALDASILLLQRAARARDAGDRAFAYTAAQAKAFAGRAAVRIADDAIQIHGGEGSLAGHGIERHWRDAKTTELNPSTRESALLLVARHLLVEEAQ